MFVHDRIPNFMPGRVCPRSNARGEQVTAAVAAVADRGRTRNANFSFHIANYLFRFRIATMNHQPTRTFWNPAAKENHNETKRRADSKSETPTQPDWYPTRIEQHQRSGCTKCGTDPVRAIDDQINPSAHTCRNQFVNCRVDRSVFAADACAGQRAKECVAPEVPGES